MSSKISVKELKKRMDHWSKGDLLIDLRTIEEVNKGSIGRAVNIPIAELEDNIEKIRKYSTIYLHCHAGGRAERAAKLLDQNNFNNVIIVPDGMKGWEDAGLPILTSS